MGISISNVRRMLRATERPFVQTDQMHILMFATVAILSLGCWFVLGFPFGHHNESYLWASELDQRDFWYVLTQKLEPVATYRPFGTATAWLSYRLSGGSIMPQQVLNFVIGAAAWLILFTQVPARRYFAWLALVVNGAFFAGYIYLFHIHGVFYSPILLLLAVLLLLTLRQAALTYLIPATVLAALAALYHPFALVLYAAWVAGVLLEYWPTLNGRRRLVIAASVLVAGVAIRLATLGRGLPDLDHVWRGSVLSYQSLEVQRVLAGVACGLSLATVASTPLRARPKAVTAGIAVALALACTAIDLPLLFVWLGACLFKALLLRQWSLATLLLGTAALPVATATGSPTYAIFTLMVASVITVLDVRMFEQHWLHLQQYLAIGCIVLGISAVTLLKAGVDLPGVSAVAAPLLAEQEKTFQLEQLLAWTKAHEQPVQLAFCSHDQSATNAANLVSRRTRPPTYAVYLNAYTNNRSAVQLATPTLLLCFGGEQPERQHMLYHVEGRYSGTAAIYAANQ